LKLCMFLQKLDHPSLKNRRFLSTKLLAKEEILSSGIPSKVALRGRNCGYVSRKKNARVELLEFGGGKMGKKEGEGVNSILQLSSHEKRRNYLLKKKYSGDLRGPFLKRESGKVSLPGAVGEEGSVKHQPTKKKKKEEKQNSKKKTHLALLH